MCFFSPPPPPVSFDLLGYLYQGSRSILFFFFFFFVGRSLAWVGSPGHRGDRPAFFLLSFLFILFFLLLSPSFNKLPLNKLEKYPPRGDQTATNPCHLSPGAARQTRARGGKEEKKKKRRTARISSSLFFFFFIFLSLLPGSAFCPR